MLKDLEPNIERRASSKRSSDVSRQDNVEVVTKRLSRLSLVVERENTVPEDNPLLLNGNCVDDYLTDDVLCSNVWKALSIARRDKFISHLEQALEATTKPDALQKLKKAFATAGRHCQSLMDVLPWLSEELIDEED
eukprot:TRINITY_DN1719_c0_g1_i5.p1 TRINITY_DN1719_c0_g1~~TRINITY_DN1719_c0_g1_i5.p1  ORF type:complete len:136 (+),score=29.17 TRINITY_DN1719_c0_g1_i5:46-453(+)